MDKLTPKYDKPVDLTHDELVIRAVSWLKRNQRCGVAVPELNTYAMESPDAFGWRSCGMETVLVECKTTRADFFADSRKRFRQVDGMGLGNYRWYVTNRFLVEPDEVPAKWGLIEVHGREVVKIVEPQRFYTGHPDNDDRMLMYSLLRRMEVRGLLNEALADKWRKNKG